MQGLRRMAWLAMVVCAGILAQMTAASAAPRDAIRKLPSITTTTRWITQNDNEELFIANWDVGWNSGDIKAGAFNTRLDFNYRLSLQDRQDANGGFTSNIREDNWRFRLDLNRRGYLSGWYQFEHNENSSDRFPSEGARNMNLRSSKQFYLELSPEKLPRFTVTARENSNVNYNGFNINRTNDDIYWKGYSEIKGRTARGGYEVQIHNESLQSKYQNGNEFGGSNNNKFHVVGNRDMEIGRMGRLQMQVNYTEDSGRNQNQERQNTITDLKYAIGFNGDITNYPMGYRFQFNSRHWGNLANASNRSTERIMQLNFRPPMPEGRDMNIIYDDIVQDFDNENNDTASTRQTLRTSFRINPRTTADLIYNLHHDFNNLEGKMTQDNSSIEAKLDYTMPGGRSRHHLGMLQQQSTGPDRVDSREYTKYTYRTNASIGRQANMSMEISQAYNDAYSAASLTSTPTDNLQTRFTYDLTGPMAGPAGGQYNISAVWSRNLLRREVSFQKNDQHQLNLNLSYATNAQWRYELYLQSNYGWTYNGFTGGPEDLTDRYSNSDRIEAKVTHTF